MAEIEAIEKTGIPFWAIMSGELDGVEVLLEGRLWVLLRLLLFAECPTV